MENTERGRKCKCKEKKKKVIVKKPATWRDEVMQIKAKNKVSFKDALYLASERRRSMM